MNSFITSNMLVQSQYSYTLKCHYDQILNIHFFWQFRTQQVSLRDFAKFQLFLRIYGRWKLHENKS